MKVFLLTLISLFSLGVLSESALSDELLINNEYRSRFEGLSATTQRTLTRNSEGEYILRVRSSNWVASLTEVSRFIKDEDGSFRPLQHRSTRSVFGVRREELTRFDWDSMQAVYTYRDDTRTVDIQPGYTDRLLYQYLMELDLQKGEVLLSYDVIDRGRLRDFSFELLAEEELNINGTRYQALKYRRITDDDSRETLVWFAPELNYRLLQIEHTEDDGAEYAMSLRS